MLIGIFKCWHSKFFFLLVLCGCSSLVKADLQVSNSWVKLAPPGAKANAAYAQFYNPEHEAVVITSLSASCCKTLMLHRTRYENDRAFMEHVSELIIPAQSHVDLVPGGLHIMLMDASKPLRVGDQVEIQLRFNNGRQQTIHLLVSADEQ